MKWLIGVFAALMITSSTHALDINLKADSGQSCAAFRGCFNIDCWLSVWPNKPKIACTLVENVGVRCKVAGHGVTSLPDVLTFDGSFGWQGDKFKIEATGYNNLNIRILCNSTSSCYQFQLWNDDTKYGFGCDVGKWVPVTVKPAPLPPPLLRKPDASNVPSAPTNVELEKKDWTL